MDKNFVGFTVHENENKVKDIKNRLKNRIKNLEENPYDIKAPTNWLNDYESITGLNRENFKNFIISKKRFTQKKKNFEIYFLIAII